MITLALGKRNQGSDRCWRDCHRIGRYDCFVFVYYNTQYYSLLLLSESLAFVLRDPHAWLVLLFGILVITDGTAEDAKLSRGEEANSLVSISNPTIWSPANQRGGMMERRFSSFGLLLVRAKLGSGACRGWWIYRANWCGGAGSDDVLDLVDVEIPCENGLVCFAISVRQ
jgi:hypothetical protein